MDERIMDLEMRFAFQQDLLEKLNEELTEQRTIVDDLHRRLEALETADEEEEPGEGSGSALHSRDSTG